MKYLAILAILAASPVAAQNCGPADQVADLLLDGFGEHVRAAGLTSDGAFIFQLYGNAETGTWTIIRIAPTGVACLMASGEMFQAMSTPPAGEVN